MFEGLLDGIVIGMICLGLLDEIPQQQIIARDALHGRDEVEGQRHSTATLLARLHGQKMKIFEDKKVDRDRI